MLQSATKLSWSFLFSVLLVPAKVRLAIDFASGFKKSFPDPLGPTLLPD
jgi:hypothetical protein